MKTFDATSAPFVPTWEARSRLAAVTRLVYAANGGQPLSGLYNLVPAWNGWQVLTWFDQARPIDEPWPELPRRHSAHWLETLSAMGDLVGFPTLGLFEVFGRNHTSLPRGHVTADGVVHCTPGQDDFVPGSKEKVRRAFLLPGDVPVVEDEQYAVAKQQWAIVQGVLRYSSSCPEELRW